MTGFIAVHTGAGNCLDESKYEKVCKEACQRATNVLKSNGSVLEACEAAIIRLENSGQTNAGFGSNLTWNKTVECEASIMDGRSLRFGAATNLTDIANPISLAKIICERQSKLLSLDRIPPMVLSGAGASAYAKEMNIRLVDNSALMSKKAIKSYDHYTKKIHNYEQMYGLKVTPLDTVGAICVDAEGNCAAGCSSGGLMLKIPGRIGQAATYGAGCWATSMKNNNNDGSGGGGGGGGSGDGSSFIKSAATCTTGNGEYLMKTLLAREIVLDLLNCECPVTSLYDTFKKKFVGSPFLSDHSEVYGGALSLVYDQSTGDGEILWSHTTQSFCIGYQTTTQKSPRFVLSALPKNTKPGTTTVVYGQRYRLLL